MWCYVNNTIKHDIEYFYKRTLESILITTKTELNTKLDRIHEILIKFDLDPLLLKISFSHKRFY